MKYRYLKFSGVFLWGKHTITKQDLLDVRSGVTDKLVDLHEGKYFDADNNQWKDVEGDK